MLKKFDFAELRRDPQIAFYFRYPLHAHDFHELRENRRLLGYFAAKPLYGKITKDGRIDRSAGYNGRIAIIFIPSPARTVRSAELMFTRMPHARVTLPNGRRNWPAIRAAAEQAVRRRFNK